MAIPSSGETNTAADPVVCGSGTSVVQCRPASVVVASSEMVLFEWLRDARHPKFREVQKLLK